MRNPVDPPRLHALAALAPRHLVAAVEILELDPRTGNHVTITLDFAAIFAWVGGLICAAVTLWLLCWGLIYLRGLGEFLGLWEAIGQGFRNLGTSIASKFRRQS
jgi:hypothetical protein